MSKKVVIFTSPTCGPCKDLKPKLIEQAETRGFNLEIVELSDDTRPRFTQHGIRAVPVTMLMENESEVERVAGRITPMALEAKLNDWKL